MDVIQGNLFGELIFEHEAEGTTTNLFPLEERLSRVTFGDSPNNAASCH